MKGSLKWYLGISIKTLLLVVAWSVLMYVFLGDTGLGEDFYHLIYYIMLGYGIFGFATALVFYKKDIPLAISMGASRKEAFWGSSAYTLMNIAAVFVLLLVIGLIAGKEKQMGNWCFLAALIIILGNAFGLFLGIVYQIFGRVAAVVTGIAMYLLFMAGIFYILGGSESISAFLLETADSTGIWHAMTAAVTALLWGGVSLLHYRTIRKMTV
ncbi:MAG: hypothetical protein NC086_02440 [Alistipes sp.]|nr:hypothetical protein [Alistipes sp.]